MASDNALRILGKIDRDSYSIPYKKILYDGGYHWMKLFSLKTLLILPVFDFFETEFIITDKGILMKEEHKHEYFRFLSDLYYRESFSLLGLLFNYRTFTFCERLGYKPTEYVYKKVKNAKLFKEILDSFNVKKIG